MTEDEFLQKVTELTPRIKRYAKSATNNVDDSEDILQDTIVLAWRNIDRYDPTRSDFSTWFISIYRNALNRYFRDRSGSGSSDIIPIDDLAEVAQQERTPSLEYVLPKSDDALALEQALIELGGIHEVVIRDCFIGGMTFEEVAQQTGILRRKIRRIVATGLKRLRRIMEVQAKSKRKREISDGNEES